MDSNASSQSIHSKRIAIIDSKFQRGIYLVKFQKIIYLVKGSEFDLYFFQEVDQLIAQGVDVNQQGGFTFFESYALYL